MEAGDSTRAPSPAVSSVADIDVADRPSLAKGIADRVAQAPMGRFWSLRLDERPRSRTYEEMWDRSGRMAAALVARGLPHGSLVALLIQDGLDFIPSFWACLRAGHVAVPLGAPALEQRFNGQLESLVNALALTSPRLAIVDDSLSASIVSGSLSCDRVTPDALHDREALAEDVVPAELACLLATSGSTGITKLVSLSQAAMLYRGFKVPRATPLHRRGLHLDTLPIDSTTGIACAILAFGESAHLPMSVVARDPTSLFDAIEMMRPASVSITTTVADLVVKAADVADRAWDLSSLRQVGVGAEAVLPSTVRRLDAVLRRFKAPAGIIRAGYGTTETGTLLTGADPLASDLVGGLGVPLGGPAPNVAIRVVDGAGAVVPEGTVGEVEVHAPLKMFSGYWGDPEATARGFTADGWWRTGDTGLLWSGQLALKGRTKEVFIANGRKHALGAIDDAMRDALDPGDAAYACVLPAGDDAPEGLGVALVPGAPDRRVAAEAAVRRAVGSSFGVRVAIVRVLPPSDLPLTATGKIKRADLVALLAGPELSSDGAPARGAEVRPAAPAGGAVEEIWEVVFGPGSAQDPHADFFSLGGDSLRAADLFARIARDAGMAVEPRLFFADPTLATLSNLVQAAPRGAVDAGPATPDVWPLSADQYRKQLVFVEQWPGERPTPDRLIVGFNAAGSKPPIFLVCQEADKVINLAHSLGPDQPVFGLRSGALIINHREDEVQAFALRYVADIEALCPTGPILLAGICQSGFIAIAVAHHLLQRRRHVPLLALIEWPARLHPYPGRVLFIYGAESRRFNPYFSHREPELGWRRHYADVEMVAVPGGHFEPVSPEGMPGTAAILAERFDRALRLPAVHLADEHRRAEIRPGPLMSRIEAGQTFALTVEVTNASATPWTETASSGLMLGYHWAEAGGTVIEPRHGRAPLPAMAPNAPESVRLTVMAPEAAGRLSLVVDVVEEGNVWFGSRHPERTATIQVDVAARDVDPRADAPADPDAPPSGRTGPATRVRARHRREDPPVGAVPWLAWLVERARAFAGRR